MRDRWRFRRMRELLDPSVLPAIPAGSTVEVAAADADLQTHEQLVRAYTELACFRISLRLHANVPIGQITVRSPAR